jgi:spermidine synthase
MSAAVRPAMNVDFVGLAQDCRSADEFESRALEHAGRVVGFDAAFFLVRGNEPAATMLGLDAATEAMARRRGGVYGEELMPVKRAALAARGVAVDTEVCGISAVKRSRYYREVARTVGGEHTLAAYLRFGGRVVAGMLLGRGGRGFTPGDVRRVESWLPALAVARASHGLPWVPDALPPAPSSLLRAVGMAPSTQTLETVRMPWGSITVRDRAGFREMVALQDGGELVWSRVSLVDSRRSGWPYVELFHLAAALAKVRGRALFVGSGGAVALRQFASAYPGLSIELVERDAVVIDLARRWFDLDSIPGLTVHVADGAEHLRRAPAASWDVIVLDVYDGSGFARTFAAPDLLRGVRRTLREGGALACNVIGTLGAHGNVAAFVRGVQAVFGNARILPVLEPDEDFSPEALRNVVVVAERDTAGAARV